MQHASARGMATIAPRTQRDRFIAMNVTQESRFQCPWVAHRAWWSAGEVGAGTSPTHRGMVVCGGCRGRNIPTHRGLVVCGGCRGRNIPDPQGIGGLRWLAFEQQGEVDELTAGVLMAVNGYDVVADFHGFLDRVGDVDRL